MITVASRDDQQRPVDWTIADILRGGRNNGIPDFEQGEFAIPNRLWQAARFTQRLHLMPIKPVLPISTIDRPYLLPGFEFSCVVFRYPAQPFYTPAAK
jgi:hypothetical protein